MNWEQFLTDHHIEYVTSGPNTKRGEVSIPCPWCGNDDPSQHLGINLTKELWGCHRNVEHRGKSPGKLIQAILGCSLTQAKLTLKQYTTSDPNDFEKWSDPDDAPEWTRDQFKQAHVYEGSRLVHRGSDCRVEWSMSFKFFDGADKFGQYLNKRGFFGDIARLYHLKCAIEGRYRDRILFPLYAEDGKKLIGWTGRSIHSDEPLRYLASSPRVKETVYGYESACAGGDVLIIVEGPFDALTINRCFASLEHTICGVALMGTYATPAQQIILRKLKKKFDSVIIMLDSDAGAQAFALQDQLGSGIACCLLDPSQKDPASMPIRALKNLIMEHLLPA